MDTHLERAVRRAIGGPGRRGAGRRLRTWLLPLAALTALAAACALPPPVEERPLDAGVEVTSPRVDSALSRGEAPAADEVDGDPAPAEPPPDGRPAQDARTDVIEVQSSESSPLTRVGGAEDTVAESGAASADAGGAGAPDDAGAPGEDVPESADAGSPAGPSTAPQGNAGAADPEPNAADGSATPAATAEAEAGGDGASEPTGADAGSDADPGADAGANGTIARAAPDGGAAGERATGDGTAAPADVAPGPGPTTIERRRLPSDGPSYLIGGRTDGPVVVFLHSWCGNADQWRAELRRLVPDRRVIALDFPGHGQSRDVEREEWTIPAFATDVVALLRAEEIGSAVLVGHGMGGTVALEVAARMPARISAVVGVDSLQALAGEPNPVVQQSYVERFEADFELEMDRFVKKAVGEGTSVDMTDRISRDAQEVDKEAAMALMQHFGEYDVRGVTRNVQCSVVCINSDVQETDVKGNRALLSSFDVRLLEGVGHWVHLEAPERFHAELVSLLDSLAATGEAVAEPAPASPSAPAVRSIGTVIAAEDAGALAAFYVEVLGFEVASRTPADPDLPAESVTLAGDGTRIIARSSASYRAEFGDDAPLPRATLAVEVARLGPVLERAAEAVVEPAGPDGSGGRRAVLADPAGNRIRVSEPAPGDGADATQGG